MLLLIELCGVTPAPGSASTFMLETGNYVSAGRLADWDRLGWEKEKEKRFTCAMNLYPVKCNYYLTGASKSLHHRTGNSVSFGYRDVIGLGAFGLRKFFKKL